MSGDHTHPLAATLSRLSTPLDPEPTAAEPRLPRLTGVRAVVFDVYGTLIISGSGDISLTSGTSRGDAALEALQAVSGEPQALAPGASAVTGDQLVEALHTAIKTAHATSPHEYPEVEIREIWATVLSNFGLALDATLIEQFAVEYECRVNPVWPMPELTPTLAALRDAGLTMGIVSNAQFFTPLAVETLAGQSLPELGFTDPLCVWSYAHQRAKPGTFLYEQSAAALAKIGIAPAEVLYVGNDMRNDVAPAAAVGFRTALFAGDARSLRWREGDPLVAGARPDAVVTQLSQILTILSLADG